MGKMLISEATRMNADIRYHVIREAMKTSGIVQQERDNVQAWADFAEEVRQEILRQNETSDAELRTLAIAAEDFAKRVPDAFGSFNFCFSSARPGSYYAMPINLCGIRVDLYPNGARKGGVETHLTDQQLPDWDGTKNTETGETMYGKFYPRKQHVIADTSYMDKFTALEAADKACAARRTELTAALSAKLKTFKTVGKLLANWPEAEELLPKYLMTSTDVALSTDMLSALCGIPSGDRP